MMPFVGSRSFWKLVWAFMDKPTSSLSKLDALRAYAKMIHNSSADHLESLLAEDFHYASQWVLEEITCKEAYLDYIRQKLATIRKNSVRVWAEIGELLVFPDGPCLIMAQGEKDNLVAVVLAEVEDSRIKRLDMCFIPSPEDARRTGEYPE
jgi:hypothetical protein